MPNCDFYALWPDLGEVLGFIFAQPGWRLMELSSEPERPLREFRREQELLDAFPELESLAGPIHLQLYSEHMEGAVRIRRIDFKAKPKLPPTYRYESNGWGLIQLYLGFLRDGRLTPCHTNHNSEARALAWEPHGSDLGPVSAWNWAEVTRTSVRLNRFIRKLSADKSCSRPILKSAAEARARGLLQLSPN